MIDGDFYVSPRYLARSTAVGGSDFDPLRDLGWDLHHDDLGNPYLASPDNRVRLGYLPEGDDDGLRRINTYKDAFGTPAWGVCFNDSAPTELVTAFTCPSGQVGKSSLEKHHGSSHLAGNLTSTQRYRV